MIKLMSKKKTNLVLSQEVVKVFIPQLSRSGFKENVEFRLLLVTLF